MSLKILTAVHAMIGEQIKLLQEEEARNSRDRQTRAVAIKAKNLKAGDLVEWAYGMGQQEVNGWGREGSWVLLSTRSGHFWRVDSEQRVRVYR